MTGQSSPRTMWCIPIVYHNTISVSSIFRFAFVHAGVKVSSTILEKYTGRYVFHDGSRNVVGFMGMNQNVSLYIKGMHFSECQRDASAFSD
jgi:hypothetical protein